METPEVSDCHIDKKDINLDRDTSSDTTEEWNLDPEVIDIKPMDLRLTPEVDSLEELLKSPDLSDITDDDTVDAPEVQHLCVDLSKSRIEVGF